MPLQSATPAPAVLDDFLASAGLSRGHRLTVLVFLRSDCPWCASEVPRLSDVFARGAKFDLLVLGIAGGTDSPETATRFAGEKALVFPVVTDQTGELRSAFAIERVPTIVIINGSGLIERTFEGVTEQLGGIVAQTLSSVANNTTPPQYSMIGNGCAP
jgi:peroxiredoxin